MSLHNGEGQHPLLDGADDLPAPEDSPIQEYFIVKQEVNLEVNFRDKCIAGSTDIYMVTFSDEVDDFALDAAHCDVDTDRITIAELREAHGELVEGQKRKAQAEYQDPYQKLSHPDGWNWTAEHHDLRRIRARPLFNTRRTDVAAENRELEGCTPAYGSLRINLRDKSEHDRPKLIIRKSSSGLDVADRVHRQYKITVPFVNKSPRDGLHFVGVDPLDNRFSHMYTRHSIQPGTASCIFPCIDDHGARCDWRISIKYPRTLGDALQQALATQQNPSSSNGAAQDRMQADGSDRFLRLAEEDKLREMTVVCSGFLMEEAVDPQDDHKKIMIFEPEKKVSVQKLGFAVGPFEHIDLSSEFRTEEDEVKLGTSALKIHAYCMPNRGEWVRNTTAALTMAADFFTYTFAKYPFSNFKLCFLDDMIEETVSLHSLAFASNRLLFPGEVIDTEIDVTRKIVSTLTYQWIGINMIPNTRNDLWLVLGIAHYMTDLFMKKICGNNEHRFRMKALSDRLVQLDVGRPSLWQLGPYLDLDASEVDFMALKAAVVVFILDKRLAKASGGHGLTRILQKFLTKAQVESSDRSIIIDTEKFRATCEKGSRFRLDTFWNQWVYGTGCPRFDVKAKFNKKRLCVELTLNQIQHQVGKKTELDKGDFLRAIKERRANLKVDDVQPLFTGPMTIRIHEADGTPYEHILEIREDATRSTKFEIPYNTKYKRLKRTRRLKEKHTAGANVDVAENADEALLYSLGDVLQGADDLRDWELIEWDPETHRDSAEEIEARQNMFARRENLDAALKALRREMEETYGKDERHYSTAMRKALDHPELGRAEVESLLDLAAMMFEEARSWVLTLNLPKSWRVERAAPRQADRPRAQGAPFARAGAAHAPQLIVTFKSYYRTKPKGAVSPPPPAPEPKKPAAPQRTASIKINTKAAAPHRPSVPASAGPESASAPLSGPQPPGGAMASAPQGSEMAPAVSAKRARAEKEEGGTPAPKRPKTEPRPSVSESDKSSKKRRIVTLTTSNPKRLAVILGQPQGSAPSGRTALPSGAPKDPPSGGNREANPAKAPRKPLPTGDRRPLPNGGGGGGAPATPQALSQPPKASLNTNSSQASGSPKAGSPGSATPVSARPKIKIIRKPVPKAPPGA